MKKVIHFILPCFLLLASVNLKAQNWANGGNALTANGVLGTTTNFSLSFKSNNKERGRLTNNGLWGFGTTTPESKVHINSAAGQVPFRVDVNKTTKFLVDTLGGVSIGSSVVPPPNGLFVSGNVGIGTSSPENRLHVFNGSSGVVTGFAFSSLLVENSTHNYINILAPDAAETGILFGKPTGGSPAGGIIYNNFATSNGLQFRTAGNITRMVLTDRGNLGINGDPQFFKLKISHRNDEGGLALQNVLNPQFTWEIFNAGGLDLIFNFDIKGEFIPGDGEYVSLSDERFKTNIRPMGVMLEKIMQLKPSTFQFKNTTDKQEHNGFIAQDVMKLFPGMVVHRVIPERKIDTYLMNYSQFGVLAIKGIQELLPVIEEQKQKIEILEGRLAKLETAFASVTAAKNASASDASANTSLEQNTPNPFINTTTIRYHIPQGSKGQLNIYDAAGKMIKALDANESGQSELNGSDLTAGTYTYALTLNGKVALSKQMLITK